MTTILVGPVEEAVGHALAHVDLGLAQHEIVQALQVLDVERADDADPRVEQGLDVLPALRVGAAGDVGVGQLVDERDLGPAGEEGVEVHLLQRHAPVRARLPRDDLDPFDLAERLAAPVGLDHPAGHVDALGREALALAEHGDRLAHAGRHPQVHLQVALLRRLDDLEKRVGPGPAALVHPGRW